MGECSLVNVNDDGGVCACKISSHLVAYDQRLAFGVPGQGEHITEALNLVHAVLGAHVPELDHAIIAHAAELCILDRVERDLLDRGSMALEFGREAYVGLFGIPF